MAKVSLRAYNREIEAMIDRGQLDEAVAHCQHILKTYPKHLETYRLLGKAYLEAKRYNEAVDIFSRVLAAEPHDFVAHVGMSIIRDEQGKLDDAIWHMERAFEVQSANPAIQAELQRLYGRRDGVQPPRIRMTRGALAHMYMRGELYPQAISETKSVLEEDQGRSDMQVLLAKAYFRSGQKNDSADAASAVLKRYPFCLEANRVLAEILGADRPESAQAYRQRVVELDPYAFYSADDLFRSGEVGDAAVSIERMEWAGQTVGLSEDWRSNAIAMESGLDAEQPDWMKTAFEEETPSTASSRGMPASDQEAAPTPAQPAEDIPDFLRAAGWGPSTGEYDEGKSSMFEEERPAEPIAEGDLPDWIRAMAPAEASQPAEEQEEELPDWINKIGTGELPVPSEETAPGDREDWLSGLGEPSAPQSSEEQPDWMKELGQEEQPEPVADEQPDWMKGLGQDEQPEPVADEQPDWMKGLGQEEHPEPIADEQPDWMKGLGQEEHPEPIADEQPDWMKDLETEAESESDRAPAPAMDTGSLGASEKEQDDSFAWLESLAAKQGATEGLLTKPDERPEDEPDWVKQAKSLSQPPAKQPSEEAPSPAMDTGRLGASEKEQDDSFAWLESLAAKQGATEGLLTKPEERPEEEPEWIKQAKSTAPLQPPSEAEPQPEPEPSIPTQPLGELGASEEEPEWMPVEKETTEDFPVPATEIPAEEFAPAEEALPWLKGLEEEAEETPARMAEDDMVSWLKSLDEPEEEPITSAPPAEELPAWMKDLEEEEARALETAVPMEEAEKASEEMGVIEEPVAESPAPASEALPEWLKGLEEEEELPSLPATEELPAWMRDETGEVVAEPTRIEPTRPSDWMPADEAREEATQPPPPAPEPAPAPKPEPAPKPKKAAPKKEPAARKKAEAAPSIDRTLDTARAELSRSNIPGALEAYGKLIKKGRYLEETIFDLREALYRYPVEVSIWQALGDAYMRANQLQDALDAYTKAEELLR